MSEQRAGFLFGAAFILLFTGISWLGIFDSVETKVNDFSFRQKDLLVNGNWNRQQAAAVVRSGSNHRLSGDIEIVGIDNSTLAVYGRWPFARNVHTDVLDAMARISDQNRRETVVLLDFLFFDVGDAAYEDVLLIDSIRANGNVILQTQLYDSSLGTEYDRMGHDRLGVLFEAGGEVTNVTGDLSGIRRWYGVEAPLSPYGEAVRSYGTATFSADYEDDIFRRVGLISVYSEKISDFDIGELRAGETFGVEGAGHISFLKRNPGEFLPPAYPLPLSEESVEDIRADIEKTGVERNRGAGDWFFTSYRDYYLPATPLAMALQYFNKELDDIEVVLGSHLLIPSPQQWNSEKGEWEPYVIPAGRRGGRTVLEEIRIPIDGNGSMIINYMGRRSTISRDSFSTFPVRSFARVAEKAPGLDESTWDRTIGWDEKIILVGAFTKAMADDEKSTPMGMMFGVEMQANALNTIIMNNFVRPAPFWMNFFVLLVMAGLATLLATSARRLGLSAILVVFIILVSYLLITIVFIYSNLRLDWFTPFLATFLAFITIVIYRVLTAERDKRQIKNVFGQFVSKEIVEELAASHSMPELKGENKDVTVFFSDIRAFSNISEKLADEPETLVELLNNYLTRMSDCITEDYSGYIDKYIGDAIMAIWGTPKLMEREEHAVLACKSALKQMRLLEEMNRQMLEIFGEDFPVNRVDIGIGIHSGICHIGYMGSEGKKNYTAMGDVVNLSSRLEGVNKAYSTRIIISGGTRERIASEPFIVRELDWIKVKGRFEPETIYELVDYDGEL